MIFVILPSLMADVHNKQTRSYNMSRIRAKDTKPELLVRRYINTQGFSHRLARFTQMVDTEISETGRSHVEKEKGITYLALLHQS